MVSLQSNVLYYSNVNTTDLWHQPDLWRRQRKLIHSVMSIAVNDKFEPLMELESRYTLLDLLEKPEEFDKHLGRYAYGVLTRSGLGVKTKSMDDPFIQEVEYHGELVVNTSRPDKYLSNIAPWLLKFPSWLVSENQQLLTAHNRIMDFIKNLQDELRSDISQGKAADSLHRYFFENQHEYGLSEAEGGAVFQTLLAAGTRSTHNALLGYIIVMLQSPEWQEKMQKEVHEAVGPDRLPTFSDLPNLPTVRAVLKEALRMRSITAEIGIPHKLSQDDFYEGYFFAKGTAFHANFR
jgi:cytochrome P450